MKKAQGRISVICSIAKIILFLLLSYLVVPHSRGRVEAAPEENQPTTWIVGDAAGWTYNLTGWAEGKQFFVGDILVFNYDPTLHNVAEVTEDNYDTCTVPSDAKIYESGKDSIVLDKIGPADFISTLGNKGREDCEKGMKLEVLVTKKISSSNLV